LAVGTESYVGQTTVEGKITDSQTGELLMASADCQAGGKPYRVLSSAGTMSNKLTNTGQVN